MLECPGCIWDEQKRIENLRKHGIRFGVACCVFQDPNRDEVEEDSDYDEERWIVTGRVGSVVLVVVYTERHGVERIISARKAEPQEERSYYARLSGSRW